MRRQAARWASLGAVALLCAAATPPPQPARMVDDFYRLHFAHDMGFTPAAVERRAAFLTPGLLALCGDYFAAPQQDDEAPVVDGDPFTDSQELPRSFRVGGVERSGDTARIEVVFEWAAGEARRVHVLAARGREDWQVDDLEYPDGSTFRGLLAGAVGEAAAPLPAEFADYRQWSAITAEPEPVPFTAWLLCRRPTLSDVDEAREEFGDHAHRFVRVFVNRLAASHGRPLPEGAVVVKEKLESAASREAVAVAAMVKRRPGFAPDFGDWEFLYVDRTQPAAAASTPALQAHCGGCHRAQRQADFLFQLPR